MIVPRHHGRGSTRFGTMSQAAWRPDYLVGGARLQQYVPTYSLACRGGQTRGLVPRQFPMRDLFGRTAQSRPCRPTIPAAPVPTIPSSPSASGAGCKTGAQLVGDPMGTLRPTLSCETSHHGTSAGRCLDLTLLVCLGWCVRGCSNWKWCFSCRTDGARRHVTWPPRDER